MQQLGSALQGRSDIKEGDKVVPMYSLSSVPIKLTGVNNIVGAFIHPHPSIPPSLDLAAAELNVRTPIIADPIPPD